MKMQVVRKILGLSQSQFAEYFDLNKRSLQNWETERSREPQGMVNLIRRVAYLEKRLGVKKTDYYADIGGDDDE